MSEEEAIEVEAELIVEEAEALLEAEHGSALVVAEREKPQPAMTPTVLPGKAEWAATMEVAQTIAATEFVPKGYRGKPETVVAAILYGREIGLGPMQAMQQIHIIDGKPSLSADLMLAKMREGGVRILESDSTDKRAMIRAERKDTGEVATVEWTFEEATAARLTGKDNWSKYPADMLWARCVGRLARRLGSDLLNGMVYSHEEVQDWDAPENQQNATASRVITTSDGTVELRADAPRGWTEIHGQLTGIASGDVALGWMRCCLAQLTGSEKRDGLDETVLRDCAIRIGNGVAWLYAEHGGGFPPPDRAMFQRAFAHPDSIGEVMDGPDVPHDPQEGDARAKKESDAALGTSKPIAADPDIEFGPGPAESLLDEQARVAAEKDG